MYLSRSPREGAGPGSRASPRTAAAGCPWACWRALRACLLSHTEKACVNKPGGSKGAWWGVSFQKGAHTMCRNTTLHTPHPLPAVPVSGSQNAESPLVRETPSLGEQGPAVGLLRAFMVATWGDPGAHDMVGVELCPSWSPCEAPPPNAGTAGGAQWRVSGTGLVYTNTPMLGCTTFK